MRSPGKGVSPQPQLTRILRTHAAMSITEYTRIAARRAGATGAANLNGDGDERRVSRDYSAVLPGSQPAYDE